MSRAPVVLQKQPALSPAEDFFRLRREGIGLIEQLGSRYWTDYNAHDPGITILEQLCYALTDLAYRIGWDVRDLLAPAVPSANAAQPFPHQAFFTARNILTVSPVAPDDFRRLLIDLDRVRNAWVLGKQCGCELPYYAWCENDALHLAYRPPANPALQPVAVEPRGLYDVRVELEADPDLGDLNDRKIEHLYTVFDDEGQPHAGALELRFPEWGLENGAAWDLLLAAEDAFTSQNGASIALTLTKFNRSNDPTDLTLLTDEQLRRNWNGLFYVSFELELLPGGEKIVLDNVTLRLFGSATAKNLTTVAAGGAPGTVGLAALLVEATATGPLPRYRRKLLAAEAAVQQARTILHQHRNLAEDYCRISRVEVEDVAVCADVSVRPDADIERVQAHIWFEIEQYFNPPVPFHSLPELLAAGVPVEEIFDGPALQNGFIRADELAAAGLKSVLRVSDLLNRLMDIEGVVAVNNLLLSKYDATGHVIKGAADPVWSSGTPVFDATKTSAAWLLFVTAQHQPRLHPRLSRFLFYKNGLPFVPRPAEAQATLTQLRGEAEQLKNPHAPLDLAVPAGTFRAPADYAPFQDGFPRTYGIGPAGLPATASPQRRAQAQQLKAYLLVFEQVLGNSFAQLAHTADLFSLDPAVAHTYFARQFSAATFGGYDELVDGLTPAVLAGLTETPAEFLERRNRFLDHLLARFGESFGEYALLLNSLEGRQVSQQQLIPDKIAFLQNYSALSHDRFRAFNYAETPTAAANVPGLKRRVSRLLGFGAGTDLDRFVVVEHLLLRPKFVGDALFPACSEGACCTCCGDEDPYSFCLTFVMAGWVAPFSENLELRGFADRTIRQETPVHLLPKICWVGNDGFVENLCDPVVGELADLLETKGLTAAGQRPNSAEACADALTIYAAFSAAFGAWYADKTLTFMQSEALAAALAQEFAARVSPAGLGGATVLEPALWAEIGQKMGAHFHHIALAGWQFERFDDAWQTWLTANAAHDWPAERLPERVEAVLRAGLLSNPPTLDVPAELCRRAAAILGQFGMDFYDWLEANLSAGNTLQNLTPFTPQPVVLAPGLNFKPGTAAALETLLVSRYATYTEVSWRLRVLLRLLGQLRNAYPGATLHDCDDGSDQNPVRLDQTALGNYPLRRQISPPE